MHGQIATTVTTECRGYDERQLKTIAARFEPTSSDKNLSRVRRYKFRKMTARSTTIGSPNKSPHHNPRI
jgi:hypothetical protein